MAISKRKLFSAWVSEQQKLIHFSLAMDVCTLLGEKTLLSLGHKLENKMSFGDEYGVSDKDAINLHKKFHKEIYAYMEHAYKATNQTAEMALVNHYHFKNLGITDPDDIKAVTSGDTNNKRFNEYAIAQTKYIFDLICLTYSIWYKQP